MGSPRSNQSCHSSSASKRGYPPISPVGCLDQERKSFSKTSTCVASLPSSPSPSAWTRELVETAERAVEENSQIAHATVLEPERLAMPEATAALLDAIRAKLGMDTGTALADDDDIPF